MDTFASAAETGQEIGRIVGKAGTRGSRGDLRSPARLPDSPRGDTRAPGPWPSAVGQPGIPSAARLGHRIGDAYARFFR